MNQGKYVFSQLIEFIPRYQFDKLVRLYKGDWHVKNLNKKPIMKAAIQLPKLQPWTESQLWSVSSYDNF